MHSKGKLNNRHGTGSGHGTLYNKERRREEAMLRKIERGKLSAGQQLAKLDSGGFTATRERARLMRLGKRKSK